ncbi:MAG: DUF2156 domain-containing protein [Lentisphaerae bacterium]|jgi:hypothetical protein|nr:DUF2156 domain-containing protein [Lentisphaerota bacterium]
MFSFPLESLKALDISDQPALKPLILSLEPHSCELNFLNLYTWARAYSTHFAIYAGLPWFWFPPASAALLPRAAIHDSSEVSLPGNQGEDLLLFPGGFNRGRWPSPELLAAVMWTFRQAGYAGIIRNVPVEYVQSFPEVNSLFRVDEESSAMSEYLYSVEQLQSLQGQKLAKKKNLIAQFRQLYPSHSVRGFSSELIPDCRCLAERWYAAHPGDDYIRAEADALDRTFAAVAELAPEGVCLYVDNILAGFSLITRLNTNTCDEHFEKIDTSYKGVGQVLFQELLQRLDGRYEFINREQDLGLAGLRQAKNSYDPIAVRQQFQFMLPMESPG